MLSAAEKITGSHLERVAVVYLRQSSPRQVRENFRSTERQYALAEEAARLGWEAERIAVVDGDLGISGRFSDTQARKGYAQLVSRVCLGEVGAIFGLEVSRLARSNAETQRLLEFCALTDTLVIDTDGVYDLQNFNDRLLLGLKSQMSEAELHMITSRLQGAKRAAAERGELRFPLPVGYVHDDEGQTIIDPDEEVQAAIRDLFCAFEQTGSAYGVVGAFKGRRFPKRAYGGAWAGEVRWGELTHPRVLAVLANPCYAGAYVFGRYRSGADGPAGRHDHHHDHRAAARRVAGADPRPPSRLHHLGAVPGQRAAARRQRHARRSAPGARRRSVVPGDRALRRLWRARCRRATSARAATTSAPTRAPTTSTRHRLPVGQDDRRRRAGRRAGCSRHSRREEIKLALAAADEVADRRARSTRAVELRVERARYEAIRAERAFHACEPENRLVARSLETRWEQKLRELAEAEAELAEQNKPRPEPSREQLEALARDLPKLWTADTPPPRSQAAAARDDRRRHAHLPARQS